DVADVSSVPREFRQLVGRMLEKDRERRPRTAAEVAARLRAVQSGSMAGREYAAAIAGSSAGSSAIELESTVYRATPPQVAAQAASSGLGAALAPGTIKDAVVVAALLAVIAIGGYFAYSRY